MIQMADTESHLKSLNTLDTCIAFGLWLFRYKVISLEVVLLHNEVVLLQAC